MGRSSKGFERRTETRMSKVGTSDSKNTLVLLVLRQEPARSPQTDRRAYRFHLRRMRRTLHGHHPRGEQVLAGQVARRHPDAEGNLQGAGRLRDRPEPCEEGALGRRSQSLQAAQSPDQAQRRRACEVEHPADRSDRFGQDAAGADPGADPRPCPSPWRTRRR